MPTINEQMCLFLIERGWVQTSSNRFVHKNWLDESNALGRNPEHCPNWYRSENLNSAFEIELRGDVKNDVFSDKYIAKTEHVLDSILEMLKTEIKTTYSPSGERVYVRVERIEPYIFKLTNGTKNFNIRIEQA